MPVSEIINEFNKQYKPFYIVDHDDGNYSLCLELSFLNGEYKDYGQAAFDRYAEANDKPARDEQGFCTYGSGYEWEKVFKKVFEHDARSKEITFDCEAGGFFCDSKNLDTIVDFGIRFKAICDEKEAFFHYVKAALDECAEQRENERKEMDEEVKTVLKKFRGEPEYDVIEIFGRKALYSNSRVNQEDLPDGLYKYDLRHGDNDAFATIENRVAVNHAGTVITKSPINLGTIGYFVFDNETAPNFLGTHMTLSEFADMDSVQSDAETMGGIKL